MDYLSIVDYIGKFIDLLGVLSIIIGVVFTLLHFIISFIQTRSIAAPYQVLRQNLGRTIIIGLELLIAGDIVRSIAVPPSFTTVGVLGIIVLIRAFLSTQIENGTEWIFPWKRTHEKK